MKKIILALLLIFPLVVSSCSDDDDDDNLSNSLKGTTWVYTDSYSSANNWYEEVHTLSFSGSSFTYKLDFEYEIEGEYDKESDSIDGTYTMDGDKVVLKSKEFQEVLTINGNKMTSQPDEDGDTMTFTKK